MLTKERVEDLLDSRIRPGLMMDGGNIELIEVKENRVYVRLMGACGHCPSAMMTLHFGVERILKEEFPDLEELVAV
jgi:Fe-S cluster biogenesis protein NfuA